MIYIYIGNKNLYNKKHTKTNKQKHKGKLRMKLKSKMLLASNWNKYMIVVDREESFDLVRSKVIGWYDEDGDEEYQRDVEEKVNFVLDSLDPENDGCVYWSVYDLEGLEGSWMYDLVETPQYEGKDLEVIWSFAEKEDHESCDVIIDFSGEDIEEPELYDRYDDEFKQLVLMNIIPK